MSYKGLLILFLFILLGCQSQKKKDAEVLVPRTYELPDLDDDVLESDDIPEADEGGDHEDY